MRESASSVSCLTRPTTPTTVIHGVSGVTSKPPVRIRLPTGSSPGHSCCAMCSSMTTTRGVVRVSRSLKSRPLEQRDLHRLEVVAADDAHVDVDELLAGRRRPSFDA